MLTSSPSHRQHAVILVVVCLLLAQVTDCCNRSPARPVAPPPELAVVTDTPPVVPRVVSTPATSGSSDTTGSSSNNNDPSQSQGTTSAPPSPSHRLTCTGLEIQTTACLNRGTCFAVILENTRQAYCRCLEKYSGRRCQDAQLPPGIFFSMENIQTANIATGVTVAIIIIVVILLSLYGYVRWRKKARQPQSLAFSSTSDDALHSPNSDPPRSSRNSITTHLSQTKLTDGLDPGGFHSPPPVNGASYYTMQDSSRSWSPTRSPDTNYSPWTYQNRYPARGQGHMRHSQTDNVLNSHRELLRSPPRSPSETTV